MPGFRVLECSLVTCAPCAGALVHSVRFLRFATVRLCALVLAMLRFVCFCFVAVFVVVPEHMS